MNPEIIVALDITDSIRIFELIDRLGDAISYYKIGYIAFYKFGWELVDRLYSMGKKVMLDLKLDDISNTVSNAVTLVTEHNPSFLTIHSSIGRDALTKAQEAARGKTNLLGITLLTSLDKEDLKDLSIYGEVEDIVLKRAKLCKEAGLSGAVASVREAPLIKEELGKEFTVVTPGIRLSSGGDDQKRTASYREARERGVDFVVIGRPIYNASDPLKVLEMMEEI